MSKNSNQLSLGSLLEEDVEEIIAAFDFPWTTTKETAEKWNRYYKEQQKNIRTVCIAKLQHKCIGYGSLLWQSEYPHFKKDEIPEIHDVWVAEDHRRNGCGKAILSYLEDKVCKKNFRQIGIGVGLYKDYGAAQKLYTQLGYALDGKGATYNYESVFPGNSYPMDDNLIIWLKKNLL